MFALKIKSVTFENGISEREKTEATWIERKKWIPLVFGDLAVTPAVMAFGSSHFAGFSFYLSQCSEQKTQRVGKKIICEP